MEEIIKRPMALEKQRKRTVRGMIVFEICDEELLMEHDIETGERLFQTFARTSANPLKFRFAENKSQIMREIHQVQSTFEDPQDRQIHIAQLKNSIRTLIDKLGSESRLVLRVLNMTLDAVKDIPSEELKKEQIDTIRFVLDMVGRNLDDKEVNDLQEVLIKSGLNPLPKLEGIAELYE